jgi:hypothetical protein
MSGSARLANELWRLACLAPAQRFARALERPRAVQEGVLRSILRRNARCELGRRHGFAAIASVDEFLERVPLCRYDDLSGPIERIRSGARGILSASRVERLVPSSGSTAAAKLLPFTRALRSELHRAIAPWIADLLARRELRAGRAFWSISPPLAPQRAEGVPIGFADDSEYLGPGLRALLGRALAVPADVARFREIEAFRYAVLLHLLRARDLALVSVWHPSYFTLLLRALAEHWERLLDDVRRGSCRPPGVESAPGGGAAVGDLRPLARRADELRAAGPQAIAALWPGLRLVSCWGDGPARGAFEELRRLLPDLELQPKGLIATEAFVSLPFRGARPLALRSHFFEFHDARGRALGVEDLEPGGEYSVVVTTGGGLYRYRLGDRVRVEGFLARTPSLAYVGRDDGVVDLRGEKLSDGFVGRQLERLRASAGAPPAFAMLAPIEGEGGPGYALFVETGGELAPMLALDLEALLQENPHYRWCRQLGQLAAPRVFRIAHGAHAAYCERRRSLGAKLGDVKPVSLDALPGWERWFQGAWAEPGPVRHGPSTSRPAPLNGLPPATGVPSAP